jgi:hypothetical protein
LTLIKEKIHNGTMFLFFIIKEMFMLFNFYDKAIAYFSLHPNLNATAHAAAGFGLALVLQHYINGHAFLPVSIGWALIVYSAVVHYLAIR